MTTCLLRLITVEDVSRFAFGGLDALNEATPSRPWKKRGLFLFISAFTKIEKSEGAGNVVTWLKAPDAIASLMVRGTSFNFERREELGELLVLECAEVSETLTLIAPTLTEIKTTSSGDAAPRTPEGQPHRTSEQTKALKKSFMMAAPLTICLAPEALLFGVASMAYDARKKRQAQMRERAAMRFSRPRFTTEGFQLWKRDKHYCYRI